MGREIALYDFGAGYPSLIDPAREDWGSRSECWERLGVPPVGTRARFEAVSRTGDRDFCQLLVQMQVRYSSVFTYSSLLGSARHNVDFERIESQMARTIRGGRQLAGWGEDSAVATGESESRSRDHVGKHLKAIRHTHTPTCNIEIPLPDTGSRRFCSRN